METESITKIWKVVVEISHARSDGNGECGRETKTRYCQKCDNRVERLYYTDSNGYQFCSEECALEYNGACVLEEKQDDGDE